jgi:ABC-type polysaccharide/polyol phosphate transport system ATPase subunit
MSEHARVLVESVWKAFQLGERHDTLRDFLPAALSRVLGKPQPGRNSFWALRDVSFEVQPGQVLGIIGRNGAGKSTMLKLLSRVLRPTRGYIELRGRVGSLIEVSAGFHGDLTGRENIYLQGAVLGMKRESIRRRFDEIVEFAGIPGFIDTPVKRYSSGMSARLGFAVAAHLDPDVLLIDEVLSVGDLAFQRKAAERVKALVGKRIPIVLVSHQLDRVLALCDKAILLSEGNVVCAGSAAECVAAYVDGVHLSGQKNQEDLPIRLLSCSVSQEPISSGQQITVRVQGEVRRPVADLATVGVLFRKLPEEESIFATHAQACGVQLPDAGTFELETRLTVNVGPGTYRLQAFVWDLRDRKELIRAPSTLIEVIARPDVFGRVDMQPQMRLITP